MYKLLYNISFAELKRKWLLLLIINFCITPIEMLANYKIESSNYILRIASKDKGRLLLQNKQSETLVQLGELKLGRWPQLELENNCKYEIIEVDGASAIRINYFFSPSVPTSMKLTGTFIVHQDRVDVQYLLSGVPVVATKAGEISNFLEDGINSYLCEVDNWEDISEKLFYIHNHSFEAAKIGKSGYQLAITKFNILTYLKDLTFFLSQS